MSNEIGIHVDIVPRLAFKIDSARVNHYDDVVEYMAKAAVDRYVAKHKKNPTPQQVVFLKKELMRYIVVRRDLITAQRLEVSESNILLESG